MRTDNRNFRSCAIMPHPREDSVLPPKPGAAYRIEQIFVIEQEYRLVDPSTLAATEPPGERNIGFAWDWRPSGQRRFEVIMWKPRR